MVQLQDEQDDKQTKENYPQHPYIPHQCNHEYISVGHVRSELLLIRQLQHTMFFIFIILSIYVINKHHDLTSF